MNSTDWPLSSPSVTTAWSGPKKEMGRVEFRRPFVCELSFTMSWPPNWCTTYELLGRAYVPTYATMLGCLANGVADGSVSTSPRCAIA